MLDFTTPPKRAVPPPIRRAVRPDMAARPASVPARKLDRPAATAPVAKPPREGKLSIDIQFAKPEFRRLRAAGRWLRAHISLRQAITTLIILLVIFGGWVGLAIRKHQLDRQAAAHPKQSLANPGRTGTLELPPYVPAVPATKQELLTPDGTHSKYDKTKQSYSFLDTIKGQQFTVSEQRSGGPLGTGQAAVDKVAKSLKATTAIKTGWGTAYIQTNNKYGSQTVVFGIRDLLGFIQAPFTLDSNQWITYINNLE